MRCSRVLQLLSDYIEKELSSGETVQLERHLQCCGSCGSEHQALRQTLRLVALYGSHRLPFDCREAIMARLPEATRPARESAWLSSGRLMLHVSPPTAWTRAVALAGLALVSVSVGLLVTDRAEEVRFSPTPARLVQEDRVRTRDSYQLLQALGRDDGYILAADIADVHH